MAFLDHKKSGIIRRRMTSSAVTYKVYYHIIRLTKYHVAKLVIAWPTICLTSFLTTRPIWMFFLKWHQLSFSWLFFVCFHWHYCITHIFYTLQVGYSSEQCFAFLLNSLSDNRSHCPRLHTHSWPWPYKGPEESCTKTQPTHTKMQRKNSLPPGFKLFFTHWTQHNSIKTDTIYVLLIQTGEYIGSTLYVIVVSSLQWEPKVLRWLYNKKKKVLLSQINTVVLTIYWTPNRQTKTLIVIRLPGKLRKVCRCPPLPLLGWNPRVHHHAA